MSCGCIKHTSTICCEFEIDIKKLIQKSKGKALVTRTLNQLHADRLRRTRTSGFSHVRYIQTDINIPVLISKTNILLDGRHRLCRLFDMGRKTVKAVVMDDKEILDCIIKATIVE